MIGIRLWVSLACIAGAVALGLAIPMDPCPYTGKSIRYQRPFTACIDLVEPDICVWYAWNVGYTWVCDFWCCYDNNGNYIGKLVGGGTAWLCLKCYRWQGWQ